MSYDIQLYKKNDSKISSQNIINYLNDSQKELNYTIESREDVQGIMWLLSNEDVECYFYIGEKRSNDIKKDILNNSLLYEDYEPTYFMIQLNFVRPTFL